MVNRFGFDDKPRGELDSATDELFFNTSGLKNIRFRAKQHGGEVDITSRSAGTTVVWTIPIPSEDAPETPAT